ncbi:MAG TPA: hypothetical protein VFT84_09930 [Gemmatimonadales bacterium]|nr:hypothetical protein [Gemmatimonadales bacterium]
MSSRTLGVPLKGFGCAATEVRVVVAELTPRHRVVRAGSVFAAGVVAALIALPIPLVHFMLVPGALLGGIGFAVMRLRHREIFELAEGACPCCGSVRRLGLAGRVFRLPRTVHCSACHRSLELGTDPRAEARRA